ncbi:MAG: hypothetical protein IT577_23785 [Verrucomicrobiae bacterium]|nr:hypothetical protein [Verrucomicrobiae bacterium]
MARKPRKDSLEAWFSRRPELREELLAGLNSGALGNDEAAERLAREGRNVSAQAVSRWAHRWGLAWRIDRAKEVAEAAAESLGEDATPTQKKAFGGYVFATRMRRDLTPADVARFELNALRERLVAVQERRVAVDERRIALMESREQKAKDVLDDDNLTDEQKTQRMKQVFGLQ